jgi:hypothetical protein
MGAQTSAEKMSAAARNITKKGAYVGVDARLLKKLRLLHAYEGEGTEDVLFTTYLDTDAEGHGWGYVTRKEIVLQAIRDNAATVTVLEDKRNNTFLVKIPDDSAANSDYDSQYSDAQSIGTAGTPRRNRHASDTDTDTNTNPDSDADSYNGMWEPNGDTDAETDAETDTDADTDTDANSSGWSGRHSGAGNLREHLEKIDAKHNAEHLKRIHSAHRSDIDTTSRGSSFKNDSYFAGSSDGGSMNSAETEYDSADEVSAVLPTRPGSTKEAWEELVNHGGATTAGKPPKKTSWFSLAKNVLSDVKAEAQAALSGASKSAAANALGARVSDKAMQVAGKAMTVAGKVMAANAAISAAAANVTTAAAAAAPKVQWSIPSTPATPWSHPPATHATAATTATTATPWSFSPVPTKSVSLGGKSNWTDWSVDTHAADEALDNHSALGGAGEGDVQPHKFSRYRDLYSVAAGLA